MIMGRTYSVAAETKPPKEGQTQWRDNTFIHRGVKLFVGIPVKKRQDGFGICPID